MASESTVGENPGPALPTCPCQLMAAVADAFNSGKGPGFFGSMSQRIDGAGSVGMSAVSVVHRDRKSRPNAIAEGAIVVAAGDAAPREARAEPPPEQL